MDNVIWSVIILIGIGLFGTLWVIYKIMTLDYQEDKSS